MKAIPFVSALIVLAALVSGCGNNSSSTTTPSTNAPNKTPTTNTASKYDTGNPLTAAPDYVGAVMQAKKYSEKQIDLAYVHQAIEMYQASEGHYPKTLQELVPNYLGKMPQAPYGYKIIYNPRNGTVSVVRK